MASEFPLVATLFETKDDMKGYMSTPNASFSEFERCFPGIHIAATPRKLQAQFETTASAQEWTTNQAIKFEDHGVLYGTKDEPLVIAYKMLRMNEGLHNIVQYIWAGKLVFSASAWVIFNVKPEAKLQLEKWLKQYFNTL